MSQLEKKLEEYQDGMELSGTSHQPGWTQPAHVWIETSQLLQPRLKFLKSWGYPQIIRAMSFQSPPDVDVFPEGAPKKC